MASSTSYPGSGEARDGRRSLLLWTGVLAGPLVWLALLETNYVLSYVACELRQTWFLHLATAVAVALVAAAGLAAWRAAPAPRPPEEPLADALSPETGAIRAQWMAILAVASSAWFIVVILSMSVPVVVLRTCQ